MSQKPSDSKALRCPYLLDVQKAKSLSQNHLFFGQIGIFWDVRPDIDFFKAA